MSTQNIEERALEMFQLVDPSITVLYDEYGDLNDSFYLLNSKGTSQRERDWSAECIGKIIDSFLSAPPTGAGSLNPNAHQAARTLMASFFFLLRDWFPTKDCSLVGIGTLLQLAETVPGDPDYQSSLDLMFKQVDEGVKYIRTSKDEQAEEGAWKWQPSRFRRNYDGAMPAKPNRGSSNKGMPHGQDDANDSYLRFKDQVDIQETEVVAYCQSCYLPFCGLLGERGLEMKESLSTGYAGSASDLDNLIAKAKPSQIAAKAKQSVVGQDEWVERLSRNIYQQIMSMRARRADPDKAPARRVMVGVASTGQGKTYGVKRVADALGIPFFSVNAGTLTGAGFKGENLSEALQPVCSFQKKSPGRAALVFIDEADKLRFDYRGDNNSSNAQKDFLTLLDGGLQTFPSDKSSAPQALNTDDVIWIFAGAFMGIQKTVQNRLQKKHGGFGFVRTEEFDPITLSDEELRSRITAEDLESWGFGAEFIGRLGTIVNIPNLTKESFAEITRMHVAQFEGLLPEGVEFSLEDSVIDAIAERGVNSGLGARYIDSLLGPLNEDALAEAADRDDLDECMVTLTSEGEFNLTFGYTEAG